MSSKDYYTILGVDKECTQEDIRKAYRSLTPKWHPDINKSKQAEKMYESITEAYETLSDPDRKKKYDQRNNTNPPLNLNDLFGNGTTTTTTASGKPTVFRFTSTNAPDMLEKIFKKQNGDDTKPKRTLYCTLEEIYQGKKKIVRLGQAGKEKMVIVPIPAGCVEGHELPVKNVETGQNVMYQVSGIKHKYFKRDGYDLHCTEQVSLSELINGFSVIIETLDGNKKKISHKYGGKTIGPEIVMKVPKMGMPKGKDYGNLYIHFKVVLPLNI